MELKAYKNDPKLKSSLLKEIEKHRKADEIIQGTYGKHDGSKFKACAVGCSIYSLGQIQGKTYSTSDHFVYETELGIPEWLARLEDTIFEGLPVEEGKKWPGLFAKSIAVGVNLEPIRWQFSAFLLRENIKRVLALKDISDELKTQVVDAIRGVLVVTETGEWNESAMSAAESVAWIAARSAERAAKIAAVSVEWSAMSAAESAAWSAARSAASAASAAESAAWSAARSAAVWSAAYQRYAKELLKLIKAVK
jgi:hypothetical protein